MSRPGGLAGAAALALLALTPLLSACGSSAPGPGAAAADTTPAPTTTTAPATTTTTTAPPPPGGRRPTTEHPLRVLMAGDSLMADISLAIASTVQDGGRAVARLVEAPSIPRDDVVRALWRQQLAEYDPEVIVVLIGVWEGMAEDALAQEEVGTIAWERAYRQGILEPYLQLLTSQGAEVVWVGMPPVQDAHHQLIHASMNRAVKQLALESDALTFVPGDAILANPDGTWADVLPGPQGNPLRVRRIDTTHLCAEGAVRLARPVLNHLRRQWALPLADNWPTRNWRWVFPPEDCPSP